MSARRHIAVIVLGSVGFAIISVLVARKLTGAHLDWYYAPFLLPLYVAQIFGKGGEDLSALAATLTWFLECVTFGVLCDLAFVFLRRNKRSDDKPNTLKLDE